MSRYIRNRVPGGTYFFTVNLQNRNQTLLIDHIDILRNSIKKVISKYPFQINAWVVLPDHMHAVWTLPENDADFSNRWREIKKQFTKSIPSSQNEGKRRKIWQNRFWENTLLNHEAYMAAVEYVYYNPVKHGWVKNVKDWPYSSFHRDVRLGLFDIDW